MHARAHFCLNQSIDQLIHHIHTGGALAVAAEDIAVRDAVARVGGSASGSRWTPRARTISIHYLQVLKNGIGLEVMGEWSPVLTGTDLHMLSETGE